MSKSNKNKQWKLEDYAFLVFGREQSDPYSYKELALAMDRTINAITQKGSYYTRWLSVDAKDIPAQPELIQKQLLMFDQAAKFAFEVKSGLHPELRAEWLTKLYATRGVTFTAPILKQEEQPILQPTTVSEPKPEVVEKAPDVVAHEPTKTPMLSFSLNVTVEDAKDMLRIIFGKA